MAGKQARTRLNRKPLRGWTVQTDCEAKRLELALMQEMKVFAFSTFDVCRVYAEVFEWNPASKKMLEKAAYAFKGRLMKSIRKDNRMIDSMLYAIVRE